MQNKEHLAREVKWLLDEKYEGALTQKAKRDIRRLKKGYPLPYLIGNQPFLNCKIDLAYKPLIPRPETEYWAEMLIKDLKPACRQAGLTQKPLKVLDMFSGSGCIGVAILKNIRTFDKTSKNLGLENIRTFDKTSKNLGLENIRTFDKTSKNLGLKNIKVDFVDIEKKNLKQIKKNLKLNDIDENYRIIKSDVFNNIGDRYDYIVANPPYIAYDDEQIQFGVKKYEPQKALFSKNNGLEFIENFLSEANKYINKNGKIYMEFGSNQKKSVVALLEKYGYKDYKFYKDQYNKWRYVVINKS